MAIKKKQRTIKYVIIRNFIMTLSTIIFALILYLLLISAAYEAGLILLANAEEKRVESLIENIKIKGARAILPSDSFVSFDENFHLLEAQNASDIIAEKSKLYLVGAYSSDNQNLYFKTVKKNEITYVFSYGLAAQFANPFLKSIFPNIEVFLVIVGLVLIVVIVGFFSTRLGRRLNNNFKLVEETTEQIRQENLVFKVEDSDIVEF